MRKSEKRKLGAERAKKQLADTIASGLRAQTSDHVFQAERQRAAIAAREKALFDPNSFESKVNRAIERVNQELETVLLQKIKEIKNGRA